MGDSNQMKLADLNATINVRYTDENIVLKGFDSVYEFVERNKEFWQDYKSLNIKLIDAFSNHFGNTLNKLNSFKGRFPNINSSKQVKQDWKSAIQELENGVTRSGGIRVFYEGSPHSEFLIKQAKEGDQRLEGAYNYLIGKSANINGVKEIFTGYTQAYEFELQSDSKINKRREDEKKSLGKLRNRAEEKLSELQVDFKNITDKFEKRSDFLLERTQRWSSLKNHSINNRFKKLSEHYNEEFETLSKTYSEYMMLRDPVKYWTDMVKSYKRKGGWWIFGLSVTGLLTAVVILILLYAPPESFSYSFWEGDPIAVKSLILFATLLSLSAFVIKTCTKMAYSSYHLGRDAKEREQLTLVYLALKEGGDITPEERDLLLRAIFSRSDTGLIKSDSKGGLLGGDLFNKFKGSGN